MSAIELSVKEINIVAVAFPMLPPLTLRSGPARRLPRALVWTAKEGRDDHASHVAAEDIDDVRTHAGWKFAERDLAGYGFGARRIRIESVCAYAMEPPCSARWAPVGSCARRTAPTAADRQT
jgi:hypothetical protein